MIVCPVIDTFFRRGWLSPGKFVAATGLARDLVVLEANGNRADLRIEAKRRIERARGVLSEAQFTMLCEVLVADTQPAAWATNNGLAQRQGILALREALSVLVSIYVEDGTE